MSAGFYKAAFYKATLYRKGLSLALGLFVTAFLVQCTGAETVDTEEVVTDDPLSGVDDPGFDDEAFPEGDGTDPLEEASALEQAEPYQPGQSVYFAYDDYQVTPEGEQELTQLAQYLQENATIQLQVEGHADERGTVEYNLALGERRALAVKNFLVNLGVDEGRISTISYGEEKPEVSGNDEYAWSQNRRAAFTVNYQ